MVIRVAAQVVESAKHLVVGLVGVFGGECVSLRADGEVQLQPHEESNRALAQTLDAVEDWLEETRIGSTDVWVDERPYRVDRPTVAISGRQRPGERRGFPRPKAAGIGSQTTTVERREKWRCSWL
jgi:hypothetical protein